MKANTHQMHQLATNNSCNLSSAIVHVYILLCCGTFMFVVCVCLLISKVVHASMNAPTVLCF